MTLSAANARRRGEADVWALKAEIQGLEAGLALRRPSKLEAAASPRKLLEAAADAPGESTRALEACAPDEGLRLLEEALRCSLDGPAEGARPSGSAKEER